MSQAPCTCPDAWIAHGTACPAYLSIVRAGDTRCPKCQRPWGMHPHTTDGAWSERPTDCPPDQRRETVSVDDDEPCVCGTGFTCLASQATHADAVSGQP